MSEKLLRRIADREARVAVVGLGYVGAPLAELLHKAGFAVEGIDKFLPKQPVEFEGLERCRFHRDFDVISHCDVIVICVPTPLTKHKTPDLSFIEGAVREIAACFGQSEAGAALPKLVVLESTSFPGTTNEVVLPGLERAGLTLGSEFYLAFAPERIDPGQTRYGLEEIPRVVGGSDAESGELAEAFYGTLVPEVMRVSTPEVAEMSKLLENVFRAVNIAMVNELALLCDRMDINVWEVLEAAATKPFGFMPFRPGPGLGGHCIPVDPFYLAWKAKEYDFNVEFIELAGKINVGMPHFIVERVGRALNECGKSFKESRVLVIGVSYKEDVADTRRSPGLRIMRLLLGKGARVSFNDELVGEVEVDGKVFRSEPISAELIGGYDCLVLVTPHSYLDLRALKDSAVPLVDTRGVFGGKYGY